MPSKKKAVLLRLDADLEDWFHKTASKEKSASKFLNTVLRAKMQESVAPRLVREPTSITTRDSIKPRVSVVPIAPVAKDVIKYCPNCTGGRLFRSNKCTVCKK